MPRAVPIIGSVAIALALFAIVAVSQEEPVKGAEQCTPLDERTKALLQKALDDALAQHIGRLFESLLKDRSAQPRRALTGSYQAVIVHRNGTEALKQADQVCSPGDD